MVHQVVVVLLPEIQSEEQTACASVLQLVLDWRERQVVESRVFLATRHTGSADRVADVVVVVVVVVAGSWYHPSGSWWW